MSIATVVALCLAVGSAVGLSFGAMFQHRGVEEDGACGEDLGMRRLLRLFRIRSWIIGLGVTAAGVVCGTVSLSLAPVMVVQPVGAISLVISVLIAQRTRNLAVTKRIGVPVAMCTGGVASFVILAAIFARTHGDLGTRALPLVWITAGFIAVFTILKFTVPHPPQMLYVLAAGFLFACVAVNTHVVTSQFLIYGFSDLSWLNFIALCAAGGIGSIFVQASHASGPPELAIAGLTVIDPIVAIALGVLLLGEADENEPWATAVMCITGLVACVGVGVLSRYHPDVVRKKTHVSAATQKA